VKTELSNYLLGIDLGTNACKAALFDTHGRLAAEASCEIPIQQQKPEWAEQDPASWWKTATRVIKQVLASTKSTGEEIIGIGVDSQRRSVVPLDSMGQELMNSIVWLDRRAEHQFREIEKRFSRDAILEMTGLQLNQSATAAKILWIKENRPSVFRKTSKFLCAKDFLVYRLTENISTDYSMASKTLLFDINALKWSQIICENLKIPVETLPQVFESTEVVGEIVTEAAKSTGLLRGTPVVAGGGDRPCEAVGSGIMRNGLTIGTGTATAFTATGLQPKIDFGGRVDCCCHVIPRMWVLETSITTTGACLRWFRDNFAHEEMETSRRTGIDSYKYLDALAGQIGAGCNGLFYYPYPKGTRAPTFNELSKGVFFGQTLDHGKGHFARAVLEAIAFQYVGTIDLFKRFDVDVRNISMVGGEAKSKLWNQIKADVLGVPIKIPEVTDAAALGSAILAGVGVGEYDGVESAVKKIVKIREVYRSNRKLCKEYRRVYEKYWKTYEIIERAYGL